MGLIERVTTFIRPIIERVQKLKPVRVFDNYTRARGPLLSAGLSYQAIFAVFAAIGVGFAVAGTLIRDNLQLQDALFGVLETNVPGLIDNGSNGGAIDPQVLLNSGTLTWTGAIAVERELFKRTTFFAELAREGEGTFAQIGARHWLKRDKLAIDFSLQQRRADGSRASGFIVGLGWYDL